MSGAGLCDSDMVVMRTTIQSHAEFATWQTEITSCADFSRVRQHLLVKVEGRKEVIFFNEDAGSPLCGIGLERTSAMPARSEASEA